jgi:hypothetical protein
LIFSALYLEGSSRTLSTKWKKHEFVALKINRDVEGKLVGSLSPDVGPLSSDQWRKIVLEGNENGLASGFVPIFFSHNSPMLSTMSHAKNAHLVNGSSRIHYVPVSTGQSKNLRFGGDRSVVQEK